MSLKSGMNRRLLLLSGGALLASSAAAQEPAGSPGGRGPTRIAPNWERVIATSKMNVSLQVCVEPPLRRGSPIHDQLFKALADLRADYNRLQPWYPYPKIAVPALRPPADGRTSWDFSLLDPIVEDFMLAVGGRPTVVNFGALPAWMFKAEKPALVPADPDEISWSYAQAPEFRDPTLEEAAQYLVRIARWYMDGGFEDEFGERHNSGHHYDFTFWEVLNEPDLEHRVSPQAYTRIYDKVVRGIQAFAPHVRFMGPTLSNPHQHAEFLEYFLDPRNHEPGIPIDALSYHFYTLPDSDETVETMQHSVFADADRLLLGVTYIDRVRKRLAPQAETHINEVGSMLPDPFATTQAGISQAKWSLAAAVWAYVFGHLCELGVNNACAAELIDYPGQFEALTYVDFETGEPNVKYWVLRLLKAHFDPGDSVVRSNHQSNGLVVAPTHLYVQAFVTKAGERKLLIVNRRMGPAKFSITGAGGGRIQVVDEATRAMPGSRILPGEDVELGGFGVAVVTMPA